MVNSTKLLSPEHLKHSQNLFKSNQKDVETSLEIYTPAQVKVYSGIIMPEIQRMTRWCPIVSSLLHLPTIYNHLQIYTNALSGTLRKWRKSGENPEPGVCQAQAGQPSLKKSGSITFHSLTCTWVLTSKDSGSSYINPSMCVM